MKDQYFGDINDYRKYGLLRALQAGSCLRLLVAWILTPDDGRSDGRNTRYLQQPDHYRHYDPELFDTLHQWVVVEQTRRVERLSSAGLIADTTWFDRLVPDPAPARDGWARALLGAASGRDLVFLDPDNGLEVASKPRGCKDSSKYLYWDEVDRLWHTGVSLLLYQHFPRQARAAFVQTKLRELQTRCAPDLTVALSTSHVLFLLAGQRCHQIALQQGLAQVRARWAGEFQEWRLPAA